MVLLKMRILCFALFLSITVYVRGAIGNTYVSHSGDLNYGVLGLDELCSKNPAFVCRRNNVNVTIAKDVEELMELCPRYIDYVECLGHYDRTCAEEGRGIFFQPHGYKNLHGVLLDLCDSESSLHKDYAANDECIRKVVDDYFSFYLEEANDTYNAYREKTEASTESPFQERSDHEKAENRECLKTSLAVHWLLKEIHDSCSPEARHVMLKLLRKSDYFRYLCGEHDILELQNSFTKFVRKTQTKEEREMMRETFHFEHP